MLEREEQIKGLQARGNTLTSYLLTREWRKTLTEGMVTFWRISFNDLRVAAVEQIEQQHPTRLWKMNQSFNVYVKRGRPIRETNRGNSAKINESRS